MVIASYWHRLGAPLKFVFGILEAFAMSHPHSHIVYVALVFQDVVDVNFELLPSSCVVVIAFHGSFW